MTIDSSASAREYAHSWLTEASFVQATRAITGAAESQEKILGHMVAYHGRFSVESRETVRATRRTLVAELFHYEVTQEIS